MPQRDADSSLTRPLDDYRAFLDHHAAKGENKHKLFFRSWYMARFAPPAGARILDLGGYVGATAIHYARMGHRVTSVEGALEYCEEFEKNVTKAELDSKIELRCCLFEEFHQPEAFDACCCTEVLNHVSDPKRVLAVIRDSLKADGLVFVTVTREKGHYDARQYTLDSLYVEVSQAGFDVRCELFDDGAHTPQLIAKGIKAK